METPAERATLAGCRADFAVADNGAGVEEDPEPEQVPPVPSEDESDDGYKNAADTNRFLGLEARGVEDGLVWRVADVCRHHGVDDPKNIDTLVGGVDTWLCRWTESDEALDALRGDLAGVKAHERVLVAKFSSLKAGAVECSAESAVRAADWSLVSLTADY